MRTFGERDYSLEYKKRIGVYGIIKSLDNKFLVIEDDDGNLYLVGGGIELEESPVSTLHRESIEEVGYSVKIKKFLGMSEKHWVSSKYPNWSQHNVGYFYKCDLDEKVAAPIEKEKAIWTTLIDMEERLFHEHHLYMVKKSLNNFL